MRAIQSYLPNPRHTEINRIFVNATPAQAWQKARHFDAAAIPWIKLLFDIRTLPDAVRGTKHETADQRIGVDQITDNGTGFMLLEETPGKEVVVGSVGQFWHLNIRFADIKPEDFHSFNKPGWGKLAWAISVEPYMDGSTISLELRTTATDEDSWNKLDSYYKIIGIGSIPIRHSVMAHLEADLGKMTLPNDDLKRLPGDELIPQARFSSTHHINIEAPIHLVWRYLMQLGCDRAGWYSLDWLDNGGHPSVNYPVEGWESRRPGDKLAATPAGDTFFNVYNVKEDACFVLGGKTERLGSSFKMTWAFVTEPVGGDATHLVVRARMESTPEWKEWLLGKVVYPPIHGLMSEVQLKNLKNMAERDARARVETLASNEFLVV